MCPAGLTASQILSQLVCLAKVDTDGNIFCDRLRMLTVADYERSLPITSILLQLSWIAPTLPAAALLFVTQV